MQSLDSSKGKEYFHNAGAKIFSEEMAIHFPIHCNALIKNGLNLKVLWWSFTTDDQVPKHLLGIICGYQKFLLIHNIWEIEHCKKSFWAFQLVKSFPVLSGEEAKLIFKNINVQISFI